MKLVMYFSSTSSPLSLHIFLIYSFSETFSKSSSLVWERSFMFTQNNIESSYLLSFTLWFPRQHPKDRIVVEFSELSLLVNFSTLRMWKVWVVFGCEYGSRLLAIQWQRQECLFFNVPEEKHSGKSTQNSTVKQYPKSLSKVASVYIKVPLNYFWKYIKLRV